MDGKIENIDSVNDNELKIKLRKRNKIIDYYLMQNSDSNPICSENLTNETPVIDNNRISTTSAVSTASSSSSTSTSTSTESESKQLSSRFRSYLNERSEYYDEYEKRFNSSKRFSIQRLLSMRRKHFQRNNQSIDSKYPYQKTTYVRKLTRKFEKLAHDNCSTPTKLGIATTNTVTNKYSRSSSSSSNSSGNSQFYVNNNEENHEKIPLSESPSTSTLSSSSTIGAQKKFHSKNNYKILRESAGKSNKNISWKTNVENRRESKDSNEKQGELREVFDDNDSDDDDDECSITSTSTTNTTATTTTDEYYETCDMSDEVEKQKQQIENSLQSDNETFNTNQKNQFKNESETDKDPLEKENLNESTNIPGILVEEFSDCVNIDQEHQQQSSYLPRDLTNNGNCSNFDKLRDKLKDDQRLISVNKRKSAPIPKLNLDRICETTNRHITSKSLSCYPSDSDSDDENNFENSYSLRSSKLSLVYESKDIPPIIDELIITEQKYIENLKIGIQNYGGLFTKMNSVNLPMGLKGKKWILLGNIEQIYEFHDMEFLPMLIRNQYNLIGLFDEFMKFLNEHCFYSYVLYTMNKKRSIKLREQYKQYFKEVQEEIDDKLGINSFLVQPIQRLVRYPLLLQQLIMTCFKTGNIKYKPIIELCCKVEKRIRNLLTVTNEAEQINDIKECHEINILHQGKFKKMNEFTIYDYTQRRSYRSKVFIFDNCLLYTEIRDKRLIYRGYYPCNLIGFIAKQKSFTLYYHKQKCQECEFTSDKNTIEQWIELIRDMINVFAEEEKRRLNEKYLYKKSDIYRRSGDVSMLRTPSRLSTDSFTGSVFSNSSTTSSSSSSLSITSTPLSFTTNPVEEMSKKTTWYDNDYDT